MVLEKIAVHTVYSTIRVVQAIVWTKQQFLVEEPNSLRLVKPFKDTKIHITCLKVALQCALGQYGGGVAAAQRATGSA